ncbi:MAG: formyltransferase family protein [Bdellovibrionota bacterium]
MKILFLGQPDSALIDFLRGKGEEVYQTLEKITPADTQATKCDFLVSYGYQRLLKRDVLSLFPGKAINLHISYLPWNRGADPNLWSVLENTPSGVTIHHIDEGVDTGDIIAQRQVPTLPGDTLRTKYARLQLEMQELFYENWETIRLGNGSRHPQPGGGTVHREKDREAVWNLLTKGWDTEIAELAGKAGHAAAFPGKSDL